MSQGSNGRYVPSGVNEQSWLGFEQRVQERRFKALLGTMNHAIDAGDAIAARIALEEARELRPDAPQLADVEDRLAAIPVVNASATAFLRSRGAGAVMLLLVGVTSLVGLDWVRSADTPAPGTVPLAVAPPASMPTPAAAVAEPAQAPVTIVPPPAAEELVAPDALGTSGFDRAIQPARPPMMRPPSFRSASTVDTRVPAEPEPAPITGETPDDFVFIPAPPPALSRQPAVRSTPPAVAGGQPAPPPAATPPVVSASIRTEPSGDQTRVAAVLNQYARAYGQLDAGAAREVWPTVNERALARAFAGLASQDVAFDDCQIDVIGMKANASCRGKASYVGKIGSGEQRTEARTWRFELRRDGEAWKIENAEARRQ